MTGIRTTDRLKAGCPLTHSRITMWEMEPPPPIGGTCLLKLGAADGILSEDSLSGSAPATGGNPLRLSRIIRRKQRAN